MKNINDIQSALHQFEAAAIKYAEATEKGNSKVVNRNFSIITKIIQFLKNENGLSNLSIFLNHSSTGVRLWAATYLLLIEENEAIKVLQQISSQKGILSFDAQMTLSEWKKGNLKL